MTMSTAPAGTSPSLKAQQPAQRRPSSLRQGPSPPLPRSVSITGGDDRTMGAPSGVREMTPSSPSKASSLVSIRPLPPPTLYQPPASSLDRKQTVSPTPRPFVPTASPTPSANESASSSSSSSSSGNSKSAPAGGKIKENTGRWLAEEHEVFLKGLNEHGKQWKKIAVMIRTRSVVQVRTHAQKYFQKLLKNDNKDQGRQGKERSSSILSTSTATSTVSAAAKRKSSTKGNKTTSAANAKKRRVSLEPKPKHHHFASVAESSTLHHIQHQPPHLMASAPQMPVAPTTVMPSTSVDHSVIDPSFMNTLNMSEGDLDDSLLDLLDDSSVEAVEHVIGSDDDLEPNLVEPNPVSPSVSSMSLSADAILPTPAAEVMAHNRHEMVSSPNPEDFSIHNTIGTSAGQVPIVSPTSVACMMDIKDFEQKTSNYVDALDWLMDVGVHQLPSTETEQEDEWAYGGIPKPPLTTTTKLAPVNSNAMSVLGDDVF